MTTRKGSAGGPRDGSAKKGAQRVRRPALGRTAAKRASPAGATGYQVSDAATAHESPTATGHQVEPPADVEVSEAVAHVVKLGYDVIAENIQQGREAAARFSKGKYRLREAPGEIEVAARRMLDLARELSTTTFNVCERLLRELAAQTPAPDRTREVPPFRAGEPVKTAAPVNAGVMKVMVRFDGTSTAIAHTASLERPRQPVPPSDVTAQPLAPSDGSATPIAGVSFEADISGQGIIAQVNVPKGQPPGFYSGLVRVKGDPVPLGVLTIEIPK